MTDTIPTTPPTASDVLDFWFGDGLQLDWPSQDHNELWFGGGPAQDEVIRQRFGLLVDEALNGGLIDWETEPRTRLALIVLLDQLSRNVHRGQRRAFDGDARAQRLTRRSIAEGMDTTLTPAGCVFLYMPLMHAEHLALQEECVARFQKLVDSSPEGLRDKLNSNLRFAVVHRDIVAQYGRFPYRNAVLGRESTPEEDEFLKNGPRFGQ
ncbi:MAG: DUF924 family protein [Hydrogenophaga sp.]|uniref:DUF924 family protein n=1 Tax=Hydrogenophaga sp. TaxID=1904254 RepID=UPI0027200E63|nr:DUF924 family protein [Hydrogenophaga sp.]MDO9506845.1 DUF924 family protein [Hydrogenophaga sp.]MDP3625100.1 DUF924 family protein [Hydrogenophaga sp.]